jgi:hypothetical protein
VDSICWAKQKKRFWIAFISPNQMLYLYYFRLFWAVQYLRMIILQLCMKSLPLERVIALESTCKFIWVKRDLSATKLFLRQIQNFSKRQLDIITTLTNFSMVKRRQLWYFTLTLGFKVMFWECISNSCTQVSLHWFKVLGSRDCLTNSNNYSD